MHVGARGEGVNAQKPDRRDSVHRNGYPHTVHGGELDGDVEVLDPERTVTDANGLSTVYQYNESTRPRKTLISRANGIANAESSVTEHSFPILAR